MSKAQEHIDNIRAVQIGPTDISVDDVVKRVANRYGMNKFYAMGIIPFYSLSGLPMFYNKGDFGCIAPFPPIAKL